MQRLREILRGALARSLQALPDEDRLAAALPLVCGSALGAHCEVDHLEESGRLHLRVSGREWMQSLLPMRDTLQHDLQRVAGVRLTGLHFVEVEPSAGRSFSSRSGGTRGTATAQNGGAGRSRGPGSLED